MEIKARVKVDELVASMNPLLNGFNATTIAATALAAAAAAAALALGVMAGKSLLGKIGGGEGKGKAGGKGKTPAPRGPDGRFVKAGATATKGAGMVGTLGKGAAGLGKIAGPAGAVVSVGMGLHSAYEGAKDVDERVKSGELTKAEGTVKKSEAVGSGLGSAAGGAAGAWGGAAAGAAIGSVVPVVGTVIGGLLGAAVGGWLGSKGGEVVGEKVGKVTGEALKETGTPAEKKAIEDKKAEVTKDSTKATDTLNKTYLSNKKAMEDLTQAINDLSNIATSKDQPGSPEDKAKRLEQIYARLSGGGGSGGGGSGGGGAAAPSGGGGGGKATAPSSSGGGKAGSSPPTLSPQAPDGSTDSTSKIKPEDVIKFTARSGSKESFDALDGGIKNAVLNAAEEYKASTGKIIQLNSAKRDPADQQRLYDDWVARGKTGMPVGKPGRSLHEKGQAVDIQNYNDPAAVAAFNKQGLSQKVPNDPVHFQARNGGLFSGPNSGYDVTLHGREMVIPTPDVSKMFDGKNNVDKQELSSVFNQQNTNNMQSGDTATVDMLAKLMEMMEEKMDDMIDKLSDSHSTQEQLLKYSKA
jgi:LAS superfamily LD-carboxypeptidase LdcB